MQSLAGEGVTPTVIAGNLPISPVGAITAQLHDLSAGHGWLYSHTVGGISPPQSPSAHTSALTFSPGPNGAFNGYPFVMPPPQLQSGSKGTRLSIGSSNDEEDGEHELRSGLFALGTLPRKQQASVKSDNSDSDHGNNPASNDQGSPKPRIDTRTARIQSEQVSGHRATR